jgi:hypothetical protein
VKGVLRGATRQRKKSLYAALKRLRIEVYGHGLTVGAQGRFNGPYRPVTKGGTSGTISEKLVCKVIDL